MLRFFHAFLLLGFFSFYPISLLAKNEGEQLKNYYASGRYLQEIHNKIDDAILYVDRQLAQNERNERSAIILDVDETALSNYNDLERMGFVYNTGAFTGAYMLGSGQPIMPVLTLYQHAIARNIAVIFISERPNTPEIMSVTVKNLKSAGFEKWDQLILKPLENNELSTQEFKTNARKHIVAMGYDIILNVGDQDVDLKGGYAQIKVKIPNPFYEIS